MARFEWLDEIFPKVTIPEGTAGPWVVKRVEFKEGIMSFRERHFAPGIFTQLFRDRQLVMSDTPAERLDHLPFVKAASGDVLISGLGIGMCLGAVLKKPGVSSVTVIEIDPDVIALVGPYYTDPRVKIINADILSWKPPKSQHYQAVWHDIWDDICTDNKGDMALLNRRYATKADWKGCWSQDQLKYGRFA